MKLSLAQKKQLQKLTQKKHRQITGEFIVEGRKGVGEVLTSDFTVSFLVIEEKKLLDPLIQPLCKQAEVKKIPVYTCTASEVEKLHTTVTFPGVLAVVRWRYLELSQLDPTSAILALDGVADPGNLGTIIRTADWFGIKNILLSEDTVEPTNDKVVRSTMGSLFRQNIVQSQNLVADLMILQKQGYALFGLDLEGENISKFKPKKQSVYVFGSESHGARPEVDNILDKRYTIPGKGGAESLNVAVSVGIFLYSLND